MKNSDAITRREFIKRTALALGGTAIIPSVGSGTYAKQQKYYEKWRGMKALPDDQKLNIALVGLGGYASGQLAPALQETKFCRLNGIVTGTPAKEDRWARQYNIPEKNVYNYKTYNQIADNDDIDIIYIVLPNGMHAEYTIRAAEAGKHVICEKPMATSVSDCHAMIDACSKAGKKLSIGYRLHFEPHHEEVMRLGQREQFGPIQAVKGGHAFRMSGNNPDRWRLDRKLAGGGPLMDLGIYAVQSAIYTTGELPQSVTAQTKADREELFDQVEETITWQMQFPDGATANGESSYGYSANYHRFEASDGWAELRPAFYYNSVEGETGVGAIDYPQINQQTLQMDAFAQCILNDTPTRVPGDMGLRDVKILMAMYESAETGNSVNFEWSNDVPVDLLAIKNAELFNVG